MLTLKGMPKTSVRPVMSATVLMPATTKMLVKVEKPATTGLPCSNNKNPINIRNNFMRMNAIKDRSGNNNVRNNSQSRDACNRISTCKSRDQQQQECQNNRHASRTKPKTKTTGMSTNSLVTYNSRDN